MLTNQGREGSLTHFLNNHLVISIDKENKRLLMKFEYISKHYQAELLGQFLEDISHMRPLYLSSISWL